MTVAELPIRIDRDKIAEFCRARGIRKLSLYGSVLRDDFDRDRSDVDMLVEFEPDRRISLFDFVGYQLELTDLLGREVQLAEPYCLSRYYRDEVLREAKPIYERA